jgi:hypothetical protein
MSNEETFPSVTSILSREYEHHVGVPLQMNDTAAPTLFDVPCKFDQWCMGCRRSEEEPHVGPNNGLWIP